MMNKAGENRAFDRARDDETADSEPLAPSELKDFAASIGTRNLMIIIVTMPLVFLVVVMAIIAVFGGNDDDAVASVAPPAASPVVRSTPVEVLSEPAIAGVQSVLPVNAAAPIALPDGAEAGAISLDGDRLAVRIDGPDGAAIVIYDLTQGAVIQTVPITDGQSGE